MRPDALLTVVVSFIGPRSTRLSTICPSGPGLESEGLVAHVPHRGAHVRFVEEREAVEILEARAALAGLAARHAAARARATDVVDLRQILERMRAMLDRGDLLGASDEHTAIVDAIATEDPEAAEAAMRTHLANVAQAPRR